MGTAVAAFVGLAPGGPVNTPMRVSRWGQFAKVYGDPNRPDNGPFMEGAFLAHAVYGFFQNGGSLCWVVRVGGSTPRELGGEVADPLTGRLLLVPPSGHVAGVWCRTDAAYGVHRAPAEGVVGIAGLDFDVAETDQAELEEAGVNSIRAFPGQGIRVWGARTLSSDPEWRYVPVRRVFLHLARSIDRGTRWTVFEPNDERLWEELRAEVEHFLDRSWREGALAGETANEAYYVKCGAETNPSEVIEAGQLICEIGIAPVKPGEFAILRLGRIAGDARRRREPAGSSRPA